MVHVHTYHAQSALSRFRPLCSLLALLLPGGVQLGLVVSVTAGWLQIGPGPLLVALNLATLLCFVVALSQRACHTNFMVAGQVIGYIVLLVYRVLRPGWHPYYFTDLCLSYYILPWVMLAGGFSLADFLRRRLTASSKGFYRGNAFYHNSKTGAVTTILYPAFVYYVASSLLAHVTSNALEFIFVHTLALLGVFLFFLLKPCHPYLPIVGFLYSILPMMLQGILQSQEPNLLYRFYPLVIVTAYFAVPWTILSIAALKWSDRRNRRR